MANMLSALVGIAIGLIVLIAVFSLAPLIFLDVKLLRRVKATKLIPQQTSRPAQLGTQPT